jgi:hypothetical protein
MQSDQGQRPTETSTGSPRDTRRTRDYSQPFLLLAIAGFALARIPIIPHRIFDPDELEHVHSAWCLSKGMVPYKDFFEHHTPWYHYLLRPFFRWFSVDTSFESARHFLTFGRGLSLVLTVLSVVLIVLAGRVWQGRKVGLLAGLFLIGQPVLFEKTIEMRPDVLALPFFLGALWFLLRGLARDEGSAAQRHRNFFVGGLCLGAAVMCTQKMLFVLPGLLASLGIWSLLAGRGSGHGFRSRVLSVTAFLLGMALPAAGTWAVFALHHAGDNFIANNFLLNAKWRTVVEEQLRKLLATSWPILVLALLGAIVSSYRFFRSQQRRWDGFVLLGTLFGLAAGIFVIPVAHRQYYLMPLPIACLFAAQGLCFLVERARERARPWLLILATIPLSILPVLDLREALTMRNDAQLARLRYVFENTKPTELTMDGWEGTGVFRPHAFYYYFLHDELLDMLPQAKLDTFLDALESGRIRPRLIAMDTQLARLGSRFVRFTMANYTTRDGFFYLRKSRPEGASHLPSQRPAPTAGTPEQPATGGLAK